MVRLRHPGKLALREIPNTQQTLGHIDTGLHRHAETCTPIKMAALLNFKAGKEEWECTITNVTRQEQLPSISKAHPKQTAKQHKRNTKKQNWVQ